MKKVLQGIHHKDAYTRLVDVEIQQWMKEAIFKPVLDVLASYGIEHQRINATGIAVEQALNSGQIHYADGAFTGHFNAQISRELKEMGAVWESHGKRFVLPIERVPYEIRGAITASKSLSIQAHQAITKTLTTIEENVAAASLGLNIGKALDVILRDLGKQYIRTVTGLETVGVKAEISASQRAQLDTALTNNLDLSIKNFAAEQIPELRAMVEKNLFEGGRTDRLADLIASRFKVSQRKANFLADQETGLLTAKYAQIQAGEIGSTEYVWSTSRDERVRPDHIALDGKRFSYSSPPITNRATGARNNPGEDFRCRCVALPVINFPS